MPAMMTTVKSEEASCFPPSLETNMETASFVFGCILVILLAITPLHVLLANMHTIYFAGRCLYLYLSRLDERQDVERLSRKTSAFGREKEELQFYLIEAERKIEELESDNEKLRSILEVSSERLKGFREQRKDSVMDADEEYVRMEKSEAETSSPASLSSVSSSSLTSTPTSLSLIESMDEEEGSPEAPSDAPTRMNETRILDPIPESKPLTHFSTTKENTAEKEKVPKEITQKEATEAKDNEIPTPSLKTSDNLEGRLENDSDEAAEAARIEEILKKRVFQVINMGFDVCRQQGRFKPDEVVDVLLETDVDERMIQRLNKESEVQQEKDSTVH